MIILRIWLKDKRLEKSLTQAQVANKANVSRTAYAMYEQGERTPSIKKAKALSSVLDFDWVLFFEK